MYECVELYYGISVWARNLVVNTLRKHTKRLELMQTKKMISYLYRLLGPEKVDNMPNSFVTSGRTKMGQVGP